MRISDWSSDLCSSDLFETFYDFAAVIDFLQGSSIEGTSNKRWSSKFVFPFGPNALYEDVSVSAKGGISTDRRFFARTGELLYLMLCRSNRSDELRTKQIGRASCRERVCQYV